MGVLRCAEVHFVTEADNSPLARLRVREQSASDRIEEGTA
jgi:hypothetical protein